MIGNKTGVHIKKMIILTKEYSVRFEVNGWFSNNKNNLK